MNGISSFCYMDTTTTGATAAAADQPNTYACFPWSQAVVDEFRDAMKLCFAEAMRQGLTVYVRPHLDDGTLKGAWRNGLLMQPTVRYGNFRSVGGSVWVRGTGGAGREGDMCRS